MTKILHTVYEKYNLVYILKLWI